MKYFLAILFLCILLFPSFIYAADDNPFSLSAKMTYELTDDGVTRVSEDILIKNLTTESFAPSFGFNVSGFNPEHVVAFENGVSSKISFEEGQYKIVFKKPALGKGATKSASITFEDSSLATKRGEVWEIRIPKLKTNEEFSSVTTVLRVRKEISEKLHVFPSASNVLDKGAFREYQFISSPDSLITAFIGDVAPYDFKLTYPLTNSSYFTKEISFAVPPDTAFQKVLISPGSEEGHNLTYDSDGNWIATAKIPGKKTKNITVEGTVFVFADKIEDFPKSNPETLKNNTKPQPFWESDSSEIKDIAKTLEGPKEIYEYVVNTLSYDLTKTTRPQERMGAKLSIKEKEKAICMEFTDLFIALARAKGIPAREINGFAISNDPMKPRSLGEDILHSWPEYWDSEKLVWIPVDPTWGDTTGGVDYFSHFDLSHISFVIHGVSSTEPQTPGTYQLTDKSQKLVQIEVSKSPVVSEVQPPKVLIERKSFGLWQLPYRVLITNNSPMAVYNVPLLVKFDGKDKLREQIVSLLPYSTYTLELPLNTGFFGNSLPGEVEVQILEDKQKVPVFKGLVQLTHLLVLVVPLILIPVFGVILFKRNAKH